MTDLARQLVRQWFGGMGRGAILCGEIIRSLCSIKPVWRDIVYQIYFIGVKSQSVVAVTGAFTGMVLSYQSYIQFHRVRIDSATLAVVAVSMGSELGPVLTGLMVAGRVGAAIAAEIGTMRVTEQIDALRTLSAHPVDYLVVPRVLAMLIAMPLLTAISIFLGIAAAYIVATFLLGINPADAWHQMIRHTDDVDMLTGLIKTFVYGGIIAVIACYKGLTCPQGAEGVGHATTEAVVYSSISILVSNFFLTMLINTILR
jgi:phospholipid/cholesterol/gamma-HCH transport system permease protein